MKTSDTLTKIAPALVKALSEIGGVGKNAKSPAFNGFKYATLENVIDASKDHLTVNGLTILQLAGALCDGVQHLETMILHESGEFICGDFGIALGKVDPQGVGSAISYARRYALMAALNMPAVDDDGEAAMGRGAHHPHLDEPPGLGAAGERAIAMLKEKAALGSGPFKEFWETNKDAWKTGLTARDYAEVVAAMQKLAADLKPKAVA